MRMGAEDVETLKLRNENEVLRAEIASLQMLVSKAGAVDIVVPPSPVSFSSDPEPEVLVSAPTSSSDGEVVGTSDLSSHETDVPSELSPQAEAVPTAIESGSDAESGAPTEILPMAVETEGVAEGAIVMMNPALLASKQRLDQAAAVIKEWIEQLRKLAAPHMQKLQPHLQRVAETLATSKRVLIEGGEKLREKLQPHVQLASAKAKEWGAALEGPRLKAQEMAQRWAQQAQTGAIALGKQLEPTWHQARAMIATKSLELAAGARAILETATVGMAAASTRLEPHVEKLKAQGLTAVKGSQMFLEVKLAPARLAFEDWSRQARGSEAVGVVACVWAGLGSAGGYGVWGMGYGYWGMGRMARVEEGGSRCEGGGETAGREGSEDEVRVLAEGLARHPDGRIMVGWNGVATSRGM